MEKWPDRAALKKPVVAGVSGNSGITKSERESKSASLTNSAPTFRRGFRYWRHNPAYYLKPLTLIVNIVSTLDHEVGAQKQFRLAHELCPHLSQHERCVEDSGLSVQWNPREQLRIESILRPHLALKDWALSVTS